MRCLLLVSLLTACATAPPPCSLSPQDTAWVDRAVDAWHLSKRDISGVTDVPPNYSVTFFDANCVITSTGALTSERGTWKAVKHDGTINLPDGESMPAGVTSFASGNDGLYYFVMAAPSIWRASGRTIDETMLIAVMLHESSHIAHIQQYGKRLGTLIDTYKLPDDFNDDTLQRKFKENQEFAASVARETELFHAAAEAESLEEAKRFAREARDMMRARHAKWLTGDDAYFIEAENIWLTFEGAGQWVGYQWLTHSDGGARPASEALPRFKQGGGWWSQSQGFALVSALHRIMGPSWKKHAFGDGAYTVTEMLDRALQ